MYKENAMKYQIEISNLEPDEDEPSIYITAFIGDISNNPDISNVSLLKNMISLETNFSESALKSTLKPLFIRYSEYIKFVMLNPT